MAAFEVGLRGLDQLDDHAQDRGLLPAPLVTLVRKARSDAEEIRFGPADQAVRHADAALIDGDAPVLGQLQEREGGDARPACSQLNDMIRALLSCTGGVLSRWWGQSCFAVASGYI